MNETAQSLTYGWREVDNFAKMTEGRRQHHKKLKSRSRNKGIGSLWWDLNQRTCLLSVTHLSHSLEEPGFSSLSFLAKGAWPPVKSFTQGLCLKMEYPHQHIILFFIFPMYYFKVRVVKTHKPSNMLKICMGHWQQSMYLSSRDSLSHLL